MLVVRQARTADDAVLAAIDHACWSPLIDPGPHWPVGRPFFGPPTGTEPTDVLVAERAGRIAGYIKVFADDPEPGHVRIGGLGVVPDARRAGIGSGLLAAALARADSAGAVRVWLKVLGSNHSAIALYLAHGFVEFDRLPARFRVAGQPIDDLRLEYRQREG